MVDLPCFPAGNLRALNWTSHLYGELFDSVNPAKT